MSQVESNRRLRGQDSTRRHQHRLPQQRLGVCTSPQRSRRSHRPRCVESARRRRCEDVSIHPVLCSPASGSHYQNQFAFRDRAKESFDKRGAQKAGCAVMAMRVLFNSLKSQYLL